MSLKRKADGCEEGNEGSEILSSDNQAIMAPPEETPDVATAVSFPRLAKLRLDHNISTEILVYLSKLHHITKDHKGFYRVRICRTCSGLPHLLELGSYSDLESATLANDVHEFLNHRTRHLHVITEDDIKFIDEISVTRTWRHERTEVKLLELLQERLDKSKINQIRSQQHGGAFGYSGYRTDLGIGQPLMGNAAGMQWGMQQGQIHGGYLPGMAPGGQQQSQQQLPPQLPQQLSQQLPQQQLPQQQYPMDNNTLVFMQQQQQQQQQRMMGQPSLPTPVSGMNVHNPTTSAPMLMTTTQNATDAFTNQQIMQQAMQGGQLQGGLMSTSVGSGINGMEMDRASNGSMSAISTELKTDSADAEQDSDMDSYKGDEGMVAEAENTDLCSATAIPDQEGGQCSAPTSTDYNAVTADPTSTVETNTNGTAGEVVGAALGTTTATPAIPAFMGANLGQFTSPPSQFSAPVQPDVSPPTAPTTAAMTAAAQQFPPAPVPSTQMQPLVSQYTAPTGQLPALTMTSSTLPQLNNQGYSPSNNGSATVNTGINAPSSGASGTPTSNASVNSAPTSNTMGNSQTQQMGYINQYNLGQMQQQNQGQPQQNAQHQVQQQQMSPHLQPQLQQQQLQQQLQQQMHGGSQSSGSSAQNQQQMQQMQQYYQQMQQMQQQQLQQQQQLYLQQQRGGGNQQGQGVQDLSHQQQQQLYAMQQQQQQNPYSQNSMSGQQQHQNSYQGMSSSQQQMQQQQGHQQQGRQQGSSSIGGMNGYDSSQQNGYGAASMSNPLVASYNAYQQNANSSYGGHMGGMNSGANLQGNQVGNSKPSIGGVVGSDMSGHMGSMGAISSMQQANTGLSELSEESIQRVTFMTYQFEGAKKLLFSKLNCACAVDNCSYYINLIMDSLIALYVAPTYGNPIYAQNAMRAIEYVMNSGALTSGSLYLLVTAYTPGDMEATTEMVRNLHAALKEFEAKYEQMECSTRRMNYYATQLVSFFEQVKLYSNSSMQMSNDRSLMTSLSVDPKAPRLPHWQQMYTKIMRCNHNFALRCDLQIGLPVWWPNSVQPFAPGVKNPSGGIVTNFFKSENVIRGEYTAMRFNYGLVSELVEVFTKSGLECIPESYDTDLNEADFSNMDNPSTLGCQTLIMLLIQYGACTLAMEALELFDFSRNMNDFSTSNTLAVNRFPIDRTDRTRPDSKGSSSGSSSIGSFPFGEASDSGSKHGQVGMCLLEFNRWRKYFETRISDPVIKGMYQNLFMDLLVMQITSTASVVADGKNNKSNTTVFNCADDDASSILLELANSAKSGVGSGGALKPMVPSNMKSPAAHIPAAVPNPSGSSVFSSLLAAIDNVQSLPENNSDSRNCALQEISKQDGGQNRDKDSSNLPVVSCIETNTPEIRDAFLSISSLIGETLGSGISGPMFQHPSRSDSNKYAPHFSIAHEISLRMNMSYLSILALVSRRAVGSHSMSESACTSIAETLDADAIVQSVYRELLFLGEWIDSSDGGCPLFSYTFFSFAICLKACKVLLTGCPSLAETLKKIMTLIPRILGCCGRRKTVCQILLHYQEELN